MDTVLLHRDGKTDDAPAMQKIINGEARGVYRSDLVEIVEQIADEWQMGGLGDGSMYCDLAIETARRALSRQNILV